MISFVHLIGDGAVWVALIASVVFCGLYTASAKWWRSAEGWHLMTFTAVIGVAFGWIAFRQTFGPARPVQSPATEVARAVILGALAALLVWRLVLLIRAQIRRRRR